MLASSSWSSVGDPPDATHPQLKHTGSGLLDLPPDEVVGVGLLRLADHVTTLVAGERLARLLELVLVVLVCVDLVVVEVQACASVFGRGDLQLLAHYCSNPPMKYAAVPPDSVPITSVSAAPPGACGWVSMPGISMGCVSVFM